MTTYIFDKFGFYLRSNDNKRIDALSVYFRLGKLDISPKSTYNSRILINDIELTKELKAEDLIKKLELENHPFARNNYVNKNGELNLLLNFESPENNLVNIMVEAK